MLITFIILYLLLSMVYMWIITGYDWTLPHEKYNLKQWILVFIISPSFVISYGLLAICFKIGPFIANLIDSLGDYENRR